MKFDALKLLVDWIKTTYKCPECGSNIDESWIDFLWIAWSSANIDIVCNKCGTHAILNSQFVKIDKKITNKNELIHPVNSIKKITDKEIVDLNKDLKKDKINVEDLFN
jgi:DNA-directed RNA polymerase subunit RPC12/RpoP